MSQIEELQGRITAALDRISKGLENRPAGGTDPEEIEALKQELADEKLAGEQLKERVRTLRARREALEAELEEARQAASKAAEDFDRELQALRKANAQLRENNARLREANAEGVAEPHLINKAMMAELEALRAAQAADRAETEAVLAELDKIVATAAATDKAEDA